MTQRPDAEPPPDPIDWGKSEAFSDGAGWLFAVSQALTWAVIAILAGVLIGYVLLAGLPR